MRKAIYMILVGLFLAGCGQGAQIDTKADAVQQELSGREQESEQKDSVGGEKEQDPTGESSLTVSKEDSQETISGTEGMEESAAGQGAEEGLKEEENDIRKLIASAEDFEDYKSQRETLEKLYELRNVPQNPVNPEGTWNRTNVCSGDWGTLTVSQVTDEGFFVEGELGYYSHSGVFRQNAYYVADNLAIAKYDTEIKDREPEYVAFFLQEDSVKVTASYGSWGLGFGANVVIDGEYIQGEPVYTNANVLEELFTEKDLDALEKLLPEEYFTGDFLFATKGGIVESVETLLDGREVTCVQAFVPTMGGYGYTLYFSSDEGYYSITFDNEENFSTEGKR